MRGRTGWPDISFDPRLLLENVRNLLNDLLRTKRAKGRGLGNSGNTYVMKPRYST